MAGLKEIEAEIDRDGPKWAGFGEATDAIAQTFVKSMSYDWRLYKVDVAGSIAHATTLEKVGLITADHLADTRANPPTTRWAAQEAGLAIVAGLKEIEAEIDRDGPKWAGFKPELRTRTMNWLATTRRRGSTRSPIGVGPSWSRASAGSKNPAASPRGLKLAVNFHGMLELAMIDQYFRLLF